MALSALPVTTQTMVIKEQNTTIYYPQILSIPNNQAQHTINQTIARAVRSLMKEQYRQQHVDTFAEMISTFEIKTNERHVLSLTFTNYAIGHHHANGLNLMTSLTFDTQTGESYTLQALFKPQSNYTDVLSRIIKKQIDTRDIPLVAGFSGIARDQDFYIADKTLVLYFQAYKITPGYVGIPMFPVSVFELADIVTDNGPLGRMATNG